MSFQYFLTFETLFCATKEGYKLAIKEGFNPINTKANVKDPDEIEY